MTRLILTSESGTPFTHSDFADLAIIFTYRFVWGPLPSPDELASYLAARSDRHAPGTHWSDFSRWRRATKARKDLGLAELGRHQVTNDRLWRWNPVLIAP